MSDEPTVWSEEFVPSPRDELFHRARIGELTPPQAEAEAERQGLDPLSSRPGATEFAPQVKSRWTLAMALAWIVWRDFEEVRQWDNDYREKCWDWGRFNVRLPSEEGAGKRVVKGWAVAQRHPGDGIMFEAWGYIPLGEGRLPLVEGQVTKNAKEELWQALQDEKLLGEGIPHGGGRRVHVPALEWQDLQNMDRERLGGDCFVYRHEPARVAYSEITFRRDDILALWSSDSIVHTANTASQARRAGTAKDFADLERWIEGRIIGGHDPLRRKEVEAWATDRGIGVEWARTAHSDLPSEKKLGPGESLSDWRAKRQQTAPTGS